MSRLLAALGKVVIGAAFGMALVGVYTAYRITSQGDRDERRPADAIVVLGAAQFNGTPSPVFAARLDHAIDLFKAGLAPYLVVTGGKIQGDSTTEAAVGRSYAEARGVPRDAILAEDRGRTTLESIDGVGALFRSRDLHSAVFVSDRFHMLRVLRMAADAGIEPWGSPTTTSPIDRDQVRRAEALVHEIAGLAVYYVGGEQPDDDIIVTGSP